MSEEDERETLAAIEAVILRDAKEFIRGALEKWKSIPCIRISTLAQGAEAIVRYEIRLNQEGKLSVIASTRLSTHGARTTPLFLARNAFKKLLCAPEIQSTTGSLDRSDAETVMEFLLNNPEGFALDENVQAVFAEFSNKSMQRVHEVYSLKLSREYQLNEARAFHLTHDAGKDGRPTVIALAVPDEVLDKLIAKEEAMLEKLRGDKPTLRERLVEMHKRGDLSTLEGEDVVDSFLEILHQKLSILRELKERRAKA